MALLDVQRTGRRILKPLLRFGARRAFRGLGQVFTCPCCGFSGPFLANTDDGRALCRCPACWSAERHRLQRLALDVVALRLPEAPTIVQISVDPMTSVLRRLGSHFTVGDLEGRNCAAIDLRALPQATASVDLLFASHVLEHIVEDRLAIAEIHRVLKPGGMAILPVPIVADATVEYPHAVQTEHGHVRAPGIDYFDRYREVFGAVEIFASSAFPAIHQTWIYEDRSGFPNATAPYRPPMAERRHEDFVPICTKS